MASFEFYGREHFASCQYCAEEYFVILDDAEGDYPLLARAHSAFKAMRDDVFVHAKDETKALQKEVSQIIQAFSLDLKSPTKRYAVFCLIAQELEAVFAESEEKQTDIKFRWV